MRINRILAAEWESTPAEFSSARFTRPSARKMRYLVTGGSRFDPQIGRDFYAFGIDVLQAYGLTETTGGAFLTRRITM